MDFMSATFAALPTATEPKIAKLTSNGPIVVPKLFTPPAFA